MGEIKKWVSCAFSRGVHCLSVVVVSGWVVTLVIEFFVYSAWWAHFLKDHPPQERQTSQPCELNGFSEERISPTRNTLPHCVGRYSLVTGYLVRQQCNGRLCLRETLTTVMFLKKALVKDKNSLEGYFSRWTGYAPSPGTRPQVRK